MNRSLVRLKQFNATATTGAIRETSQEKLYQEFGKEFLRNRRWLKCMCYFYKLSTTQKPLNLLNLIPLKLNSLRHLNTDTVIRCKRLF